MNFRLLLLSIAICLSGCKDKNTPLYQAMESIEISLTNEQLKDFRTKPDSVALNDIFFGYGIHFRNNNIRNTKDSTLIKYFNSLGIYHEDYMSSIVFTSLHRKLNNKSIDLEGQLKTIHDIMYRFENFEKKIP